jgi:hypothetical protein
MADRQSAHWPASAVPAGGSRVGGRRGSLSHSCFRLPGWSVHGGQAPRRWPHRQMEARRLTTSHGPCRGLLFFDEPREAGQRGSASCTLMYPQPPSELHATTIVLASRGSSKNRTSRQGPSKVVRRHLATAQRADHTGRWKQERLRLPGRPPTRLLPAVAADPGQWAVCPSAMCLTGSARHAFRRRKDGVAVRSCHSWWPWWTYNRYHNNTNY